MKPELEKTGALWSNLKAKKLHMNMEIDGKKYVAFPNNYKTDDNQPDWIIYKDRPKNGK